MDTESVDAVVRFIEGLWDFLKDHLMLIVICILAFLLVGLLGMVIIPDSTTSEEVNILKDNCEFVAYGQYSDTLVDFRLQRCVVPDGVCYVTNQGGVDCKWENADD